MIKRTSQLISESLGNELGYEQGQKNIVAFGLEVIIGAVIKIVIFFALAHSLGILPASLGVVFTYVGMRWVAGGVHLSTYLRCLVVSMTLILSAAYLSTVVSSALPAAVIKAIILFSMLIIGVYAPVENPQNPLKGEKYKYKIYAIVLATIFAALILVLNIPYEIRVALSLGLLLAAATITPLGSVTIKYIDNVLNKISFKGGAGS